MRRTEVLQGMRIMKFTELLDRTNSRELSQWEAASMLGVSERSFRRWRDRYEAEGAEGLYDRRLGKVSGRRVPVDTVMAMLDLFDTRYFDSRPSILGEACLGARFQAQLQLAALDLAVPWPHSQGTTLRGPPSQAAASSPAGHDASPGWLQPSVGAGAVVDFDCHHGRRHVGYLLGLLRRGGRHDEHLPGALRGDLGCGLVLCAVHRPSEPLLAHTRSRRQGRQGQSHPGAPGAAAARHRVDPGLLA